MSDVIENKADLFLATKDSRNTGLPSKSIDHVVTDPPYAGSVQYAELSDFFYVWLRASYNGNLPVIMESRETPKSAEIVVNKTRGLETEHYRDGLYHVFRECRRVLKDDGRLVFTFHHSKQDHWLQLYDVIRTSGFSVLNSFPVASEGRRSGNMVFHTNKNSVGYDVIHVCAKTQDSGLAGVAWDVLQQAIIAKVLESVASIRSGQDHGQLLNAADIRILIWSECLSAYSKHSDLVYDSNNEQFAPRDALAWCTSWADDFTQNQEIKSPS